MSLSATQSILATLHYFDLFSYSLTLEELYQYLYSPPDELRDVGRVLELLDGQLIPQGHVVCERGLYTVFGKESNITTRLSRYDSVHWKFKKAVRYGTLIASLPFVRMVAVCNELAYGNARDESDIDLYIVTEERHLWLVRLLASACMELLGQRPNIATKEKKDALCLSFLVSIQGMNCKPLLLSEEHNLGDIQFMYWITQLVPLYDAADYYNEFYKQNEWVEETLPFRLSRSIHIRRNIALSWWRKGMKTVGETVIRLCGRYPEYWVRLFQMKILPVYLRKHLNKGTSVIMNDHVLKMHPSDKREHIRHMFADRLKTIMNISL